MLIHDVWIMLICMLPVNVWYVIHVNRVFKVTLSFQVVKDRKILEVHVDKGMEDGQKVVFSGEGDQEPGLEPGDIIIVLDEKEHEVFR